MNLSEKQSASLQGIAIGDALGLPVEAHTRSQIVGILNRENLGAHRGLIDRYYPIGRHAMYRPSIGDARYPFLVSSATGICSDDTLLTVAIDDSIRTKGGVDMEDIIARHVEAVRQEPFGFGKGTREVMQSIGAGADWRTIRTPSFGNGVMMKQSPLAFLEAGEGRGVSEDLITLTRITHNHPVSLVAARIHHRLLVDIILSDNDSFDMVYWVSEGVQLAKSYEKEYDAPSHVSDLLSDIGDEWGENPSLETISSRYVRKIEGESNPFFNVLSTLGIAYALFLRKQDFQAVQQGASIGGDTDSYASILGSMVGALKGPIFEQKYIDGLHPRYREMIERK